METNSFFSLQLSLDATPEDLATAIAMLTRAFNHAESAQITPQQIANGNAGSPPALTLVANTGSVSGEVDKDGVPWDERIHAGTKTKTAKGLWTRKKGIDDAVYDSVVASYKGAAPAAAATAPVVATTPQLTTPQLTVPTIAPTAPLAGYALLVDFLAKNSGDGKLLTQDYVNQTFAGNNTSLAALAGNDAAADAFLAAFRNVLTQHNVAEVK